ncbi:diacylglycerol/lipid kinase family protein [Reinekea blandensis]|uniref:DAGKc domain-containing protein n=1 Tax=Reinekea blandensis MED297 TaxID=314283 RepID=A4B917_9GAMM|nr:YegS/Rv2252/BmrU family lipid kinase [Reinekea blandensis]EAR11118.1 hypothetical protein MED297_19562 [Reinekea sp. MED297] [Reinekea blandensis MED297]
MSYAVLFNRLSGRRSDRWNQHLIHRLQTSLSEPVSAYEVDDAKTLNRALTELLSSDAHSLIISGGDGTLNRVVNALLSHPQQRPLNLAVIPNGTGNSFALDLNIHQLDDALRAIEEGTTVSVDVGEIRHGDHQRFFINNFGIGLVYDITALASRMRAIGALSYVIATLVKLIRLPTLNVQMTVDGIRQTNNLLFLDICNSRYTGGNMNMAPQVTLADGQFQMIWVAPLPRRTLLRTFPKLFKGTHVNESFVHQQMVQQVTLEGDANIRCILDGDLDVGLPLTIAMTQRRLTFYTL